MRLEPIFAKRAASFWQQARPYIADVMRSGFPMAVLLLYLAFIAYYTQWIETLPAAFPSEWAAAPALWLLLAYSPIRTFLQPPDVIFLPPAEERSGPYFRRARIYSFALQAVRLVGVSLIVWPLYSHHQGGQAAPFPWFAAALLVLKWVEIQAVWRENRLIAAGVGRALAAFRWLLTWGAVWLLLNYAFVKAALLAIFALLLYTACLRFFAAMAVNWQRLVELEQRHHSRVYAILGWFVDVPFRAVRYRRRRWIAWIGANAKFASSHAYGYLYWRTFIRSDLPGVVCRLAVFALLTIVWVPGDFFKAACYAAFVHLIGLQLSSLERYHRYLFWAEIYPLSRPWRERPLIRLTLRLHLFFIVLLSIPLFFSLKTAPLTLALLALGLVWACWRSYRMMRKPEAEG